MLRGVRAWRGMQVVFKAGAYVFRKGDPGTDFYIVSQGNALVKDGAKVRCAVLGAECSAPKAPPSSALILLLGF